jgi:hypothetical protein
MHKQCSSSDQSTCNTYYRCQNCNQSVNTMLHKRSHQCGEHFCRTCKECFRGISMLHATRQCK